MKHANNNKRIQVFQAKQTKCKHTNHQNCAYNVGNPTKQKKVHTHTHKARRVRERMDGWTNERDMYAFKRKLL